MRAAVVIMMVLSAFAVSAQENSDFTSVIELLENSDSFETSIQILDHAQISLGIAKESLFEKISYYLGRSPGYQLPHYSADAILRLRFSVEELNILYEMMGTWQWHYYRPILIPFFIFASSFGMVFLTAGAFVLAPKLSNAQQSLLYSSAILIGIASGITLRFLRRNMINHLISEHARHFSGVRKYIGNRCIRNLVYVSSSVR